MMYIIPGKTFQFPGNRLVGREFPYKQSEICNIIKPSHVQQYQNNEGGISISINPYSVANKVKKLL